MRFLPRAAAAPAAQSDAPLGPLPEWVLSDLYPSMDSPLYARDLERVAVECGAFAAAYRGKIGELAAAEDATSLARAVERYEALEDLIGRITSYAGLVYYGDTTDPARAKFFGDAQEKVTAASTHLLFFQLELNRLDDALLAKLAANPPLARYRPWLEDIRKEKPHELSDEAERLFHEKVLTSSSAFSRLFDETIAELRFKVRDPDLGSKELGLEEVLNRLQDKDGALRKEASGAIAATLRQNLRTFGLVTNVLAKDKEISDRWRGFIDVADSRHLANRVEREVVDALVATVQAAYPRLSHRYYRLKAKWFG
ncbi:MAG: M3 family oligoendopeptidase, partial [Methylovirgula sp.]